MTTFAETARAGFTAATDQPYTYVRKELSEPDWRRYPGWATVTESEWRDPQWQRAHSVKNIGQLRAVVGDLLDERFYADLAADQQQRATMSMLLPPQMLNTMAPELRTGTPQRSPRRSTPIRSGVTCCRCSAIANRNGAHIPTPSEIRCTRATCGWWKG